MAKQKDIFAKIDRATLQGIIDLIPSFYFARDAEGRFLLVNDAAARAYGTTPDQMVGKTDADFNVDPELARNHLADDQEVLRNQQEKVIEAEPISNVKGRTVYLKTIKRPLPSRFGRSGVVLGVSEIVNQRNDNDAQVQQLQERLANAEKMESVGVLASGIAHDLNNLLSPLLGYPELIKKMVDKDNAIFDMVGEIENASNQAAELIQGLLTMARRSTKKPEVVDVNSLVERFLQSSVVKDNLKNIPLVDISASLDAGGPRITVPPSYLQQILINLTQNAFEAIEDKGEILIKSFTARRPSDPKDPDSPEQTWVGVSVMDDGEGIKKMDMGRIFEPFFSTKKMGRSGTGLGLAVVQGLIEDGGGVIEVESQSLEGSTFTVYFPATAQDLIEETAETELPSLNAKVLVVDDLSIQRKLATHFLESLGCSVMTAESGMKAIELFRQEDFDLCIIDMIMGDEMDGLDTFRAIQHHKADTPCIIASGYAVTDRIHKALDGGAKAYLKKPFTLQSLAQEVVKALA